MGKSHPRPLCSIYKFEAGNAQGNQMYCSDCVCNACPGDVLPSMCRQWKNHANSHRTSGKREIPIPNFAISIPGAGSSLGDRSSSTIPSPAPSIRITIPTEEPVVPQDPTPTRQPPSHRVSVRSRLGKRVQDDSRPRLREAEPVRSLRIKISQPSTPAGSPSTKPPRHPPSTAPRLPAPRATPPSRPDMTPHTSVPETVFDSRGSLDSLARLAVEIYRHRKSQTRPAHPQPDPSPARSRQYDSSSAVPEDLTAFGWTLHSIPSSTPSSVTPTNTPLPPADSPRDEHVVNVTGLNHRQSRKHFVDSLSKLGLKPINHVSISHQRSKGRFSVLEFPSPVDAVEACRILRSARPELRVTVESPLQSGERDSDTRMGVKVVGTDTPTLSTLPMPSPAQPTDTQHTEKLEGQDVPAKGTETVPIHRVSEPASPVPERVRVSDGPPVDEDGSASEHTAPRFMTFPFARRRRTSSDAPAVETAAGYTITSDPSEQPRESITASEPMASSSTKANLPPPPEALPNTAPTDAIDPLLDSLRLTASQRSLYASLLAALGVGSEADLVVLSEQDWAELESQGVTRVHRRRLEALATAQAVQQHSKGVKDSGTGNSSGGSNDESQGWLEALIRGVGIGPEVAPLYASWLRDHGVEAEEDLAWLEPENWRAFRSKGMKPLHCKKLERCAEKLGRTHRSGGLLMTRPHSCPPSEFLCPISQELMKDPVMAADGHSYERCTIEAWLNKKLVGEVLSPLTGVPMGRELRPNYTLKKAIDEMFPGQTRDSM